jgi:ribosome-binding protein aMBF1 (putative translation factor)
MGQKTKRIIRPATSEERARHAEIRAKAKREFPPLDPPRSPSIKNRIALAIRKARKDQGLTWYAVAKKAGIPNPNTVRDIEYGRDARLSNVEAVARALGLTLELVAAPSG